MPVQRPLDLDKFEDYRHAVLAMLPTDYETQAIAQVAHDDFWRTLARIASSSAAAEEREQEVMQACETLMERLESLSDTEN